MGLKVSNNIETIVQIVVYMSKVFERIGRRICNPITYESSMHLHTFKEFDTEKLIGE